MARRILIWAVILLWGHLWAQPPFAPLPAPPGQLLFKAYGTEAGLGSLSITALAQDPEGFLWVGTEDGLYRLEGHRFRAFGTKDGLPSGTIDLGGVASDLRKGMWITTPRGVAHWDGRTFQRPSALGVPDGDRLSGLTLDQGGILLFDYPRKRRYISLDGGPFKPLEGVPWSAEVGISAGTYRADMDTLVLALGPTLWIRQKGLWRPRDLGTATRGSLQALWLDDRGRLWFRTASQLGRLSTFEAPVEWLSTPVPLSDVSRSNLSMDSLGRMWTNTSQGVLWLSDHSSGFIGDKEGLPPGGAFCLMVDQEGTLWIGGDGVHKALGGGLWTGWTRRHGLPADIVWAMTRTRDGLLWAGTSGGLAVGDRSGWHAFPETKSSHFVTFREDPDGNLWIGHMPYPGSPGALSVRPRGSRSLLPVLLPGLRIYPRAFIASLFAEGNTLWLGSNSGGLWKATRQGTRLQAAPYPIPGWPSDVIVQRIVADGCGGLWMASDRGLAHWDRRTWALMDGSSGLPENHVLCLAALPGGEVWAGCQETKTLVRVRREGAALRIQETMGPSHPLMKFRMWALERGPDGALWVASSRGLMRWDGTRAAFFSRKSGLPGEDLSQNCILFDPNGDIWLGLSVGVVRGHVGGLAKQALPQPALVEAIQGEGLSLLGAGARVELPWRARSLSFRYAPRSSLLSEELTHQVRLVGLEEAWRSTAIPEARYPGLAPGRYTFEVRTEDPLGQVSGTTRLSLRVLPPWWLRTWFLVFSGVALSGLAVLGVRWRMKRLKQQNLWLEELVQARTAELETANVALREATLVDPLTGLYNRRYLTSTLPEEENRIRRVFRSYLERHESPLGRNEDLVLVILDLDHFKRVNDTYGHAVGDFVLKETASVLKKVARTSDTLVRLGGEEFLLVAKRTDRSRTHLIAEHFRRALAEHPFVLSDGRVLRCTASLGFAAFPVFAELPEAFTWEDTLQVADQCLYEAKQSGRNGWVGVHTRGLVDEADVGTRLRTDVQGLVHQGLLECDSSFPEPPFRPKTDPSPGFA